MERIKVPGKREKVRLDDWFCSPLHPIRDNLSLTGHYRWLDEDTVSGDGEINMPSVSLWYTPHQKLSVMLSYLYDDETRESLVCIPVFNG